MRPSHPNSAVVILHRWHWRQTCSPVAAGMGIIPLIFAVAHRSLLRFARNLWYTTTSYIQMYQESCSCAVCSYQLIYTAKTLKDGAFRGCWDYRFNYSTCCNTADTLSTDSLWLTGNLSSLSAAISRSNCYKPATVHHCRRMWKNALQEPLIF